MSTDSKPDWTQEQLLAIKYEGKNMLVSAAAGAGKTAVLVEKVVRKVLSQDEPLDIERLLVVTFTEKAASEMKERLRNALQDASAKMPDDSRISRQLALLDKAQISTIHSFCHSIVRRYFYLVDLDPGFKVLDSNEAELLLYESLDDLFEQRYNKGFEDYREFEGLVERYGGRQVDGDLKAAVLRLYRFVTTYPFIDEWFKDAVGFYEKARDIQGLSDIECDRLILDLPWTKVILDSIATGLKQAVLHAQKALDVCSMALGPGHYIPVIEEELLFLKDSLTLVRGIVGGQRQWDQRDCLSLVRAINGYEFRRLPSKKVGEVAVELTEKAKDLRDKYKKILRSTADSVLMRPSGEILGEVADLLPFIQCLIDLALDLDREYRDRKKDRGGVDFSDLERYCLEILAANNAGLSNEVKNAYDLVFVDEYQDTNPVQDRILSMVTKPNSLFAVGDIKQSIYRFRLAEPKIFLEKYDSYERVQNSYRSDSNASGVRISLTSNFRSRSEVLDSINYVFERIMEKSVAEIDYTEDHRLNCGASYPSVPGQEFKTNLVLIERDSTEEAFTDQDEGSEAQTFDADTGEYESLEKEALVIAWKIQTLVNKQAPFQIWDSKKSCLKDCTYKDIAILMRATRGRANVLIDIFQKCGIPVYSDLGTGYFKAREVEVALSILSVIDNPRQDIPLAAVLRSPVVGLEPKNLAIIRAMCKENELYDSVMGFAEMEPELPPGLGVDENELKEIKNRLCRFLERLEAWRTMSRRAPLAQMLWAVLTETGYYDYVGGLPGGGQRQANLRALIGRASQFDSFGRHGLFRFLRFIDKIQEKGDLGTARALGENEDVVQILSIHRAKGLEFPVVFVVDLGKQFNKEDLKNDVLFHKDLGIGAMYCDVAARVKFPTLPFAAIKAQTNKDSLAEEMRVLYVAMTRAKEKLYLIGSVRKLERQLTRWEDSGFEEPGTCLDWICPALLNQKDAPVSVEIYDMPGGSKVPEPFSRPYVEGSVLWNQVKALQIPDSDDHLDVYAEVKRRLEWGYSHRPFTAAPAKTSVGKLGRRLDPEEDAWDFVPSPEKRIAFQRGRKTGAIKGTAIHGLLSRMELSKGTCENGVSEEIQRLEGLGFIDGQHIDKDDVFQIIDFFSSPLGQSMIEEPCKIKRETPFTMRLGVKMHPYSGKVIVDLGQMQKSDNYTDSVLVQGVIDLIIEDKDGLTVLDYKTDAVDLLGVPRLIARYTPQISLYSYGLEKITGRTVKKAVIVFLTPGVQRCIDWRSYILSISEGVVQYAF